MSHPSGRIIARQSAGPRWRQWPLIGLLVVSTALIFQNCADPLSLGEKEQSTNSTPPFAFDTTVDTLAYMSCAGGPQSSAPDAIFSFRSGAYRAGSGLRLTNEFFAATGSFNAEQRAKALSEGWLNAKSQLHMSIRPSFNYAALLTISGGAPQLGLDVSVALGPLDDRSIALPLASQEPANPPRLGYIPATGKYIEGSLRFIKDEGLAADVRNRLTNGDLITFSYANGGTEYGAKSPDGTASKAFGRGYKVAFSAPSAGEPEPRVLLSVDEFSLETGQATATDIKPWSCLTQHRFKIFRSCYEGCNCTHDPVGGNAIAAVLRRVLRVEHWFIDLANQCVVQKELAQQCYPANSVGNFHYVSVCTREP